MQGLMSMQEQGILPMYMDLPSASSNSSLQSMVLNHTGNSLPMLEHDLNVFGASGYFDPASCVTQVGVNGECFYGNAAVGNFWIGEELKVGEWDLENLMKDVSSFPFLDFQS
ncbi:hypothetical protein GOBAR_DD35876 [Gossypium barbadense]|nr:hypothetical protein GOBAR_DD35876 [Gossypium barbadense]